MFLKPNKNKTLGDFLKKLEKKVTKMYKVSKIRYDFQDRVQIAVVWLMLYALFINDILLRRFPSNFPDYEELKALVYSKFDEMMVYQKAKGNKKISSDIAHIVEGKKITIGLIEAYLEEHKTDAELKFLGAMFGANFTRVSEEDGGNNLGIIDELDPKKPEDYLKKITTLAKFVNNGGVLALFEYHWFVVKEIGSNIEEFKEYEKNKEDLEQINLLPHYFLLTNSLSGTTLRRKRLDRMIKHQFYCFNLDLDFQQKVLQILAKELKL